MTSVGEIQGETLQGHGLNTISEIPQISDPNQIDDINNEQLQDGVSEATNELHPELQDLSQANGMPPFAQNYQPQDFQQHPGQHMIWNNQYIAATSMGRPNAGSFSFGIPSPFNPYQNFTSYPRMKPPEMGTFYHEGLVYVVNFRYFNSFLISLATTALSKVDLLRTAVGKMCNQESNIVTMNLNKDAETK